MRQPGASLFGETDGFRFRQDEHLRKNAEIRRLLSSGKRVSCQGMKLFYKGNGLPGNRAAFTFVRKYGSAVQRNRCKRLSREAYRLMKGRLRQGYDLALLAYPGMDTFAARTRQMERLFSQAGLMQENR
jgi:ribonuclease P protein component